MTDRPHRKPAKQKSSPSSGSARKPAADARVHGRTLRRKHALPPASRLLDRPLCGDYGGVGAGGRPCQHPAGWGVPHAGHEGRCAEHHPDAVARVQAAKRLLLEVYGTGKASLEQAARIAAGLDQSTIWRWRQSDPEFDHALTELQGMADAIWQQDLEESYRDRLLRGEATGSEVIFALKNLGKDRWKDRHQLEHTGKEGAALMDLNQLRDILRDDEAAPGAPAQP